MDAELVERAGRGDSRAQEHLVRQLTPRLLRLALRLGCDAESAEDIVSDTLYRGITKLRNLRDPSAVAGWFSRILVNAWRDRLRSRKRDLSLEDLAHEPEVPASLAPEEVVVEKELRERLGEALGALPPAQRAVLALHIDEGFSVSEIADALRSTPERVKANLWHGRRRLRRLLGGPLGREFQEEQP